MSTENKNLEAVELNDEVLEQAAGGYGNALNLRGKGTICQPGFTYTDSITRRTFYVVKTGDTLSAIASRFGMSLATIQSLNPHITNPNKIWDYDVVWLTR